MSDKGLRAEEAAVLARFDRTSPEALLKSIAAELARLHAANAELTARLGALEGSGRPVEGGATSKPSTLQAASEPPAAPSPPAAAAPEAKRPTRRRIAVEDMPNDAPGYYPLEQDGFGRPYRWTGPDREFGFELDVDRGAPGKVTLRFDMFFAAAPIEDLVCLVDGTPQPLSALHVDGGWEVSGELPARADRAGATIAFVVPRIESPEDRGQMDPRRLGLCFRWLEVDTTPASAAN